MRKLIDNILETIDVKKKEKALASFPWRYTDRHGIRWFNTGYRKSYDSLRKWC